jgi:hypothetical protein
LCVQYFHAPYRRIILQISGHKNQVYLKLFHFFRFETCARKFTDDGCRLYVDHFQPFLHRAGGNCVYKLVGVRPATRSCAASTRISNAHLRVKHGSADLPAHRKSAKNHSLQYELLFVQPCNCRWNSEI